MHLMLLRNDEKSATMGLWQASKLLLMMPKELIFFTVRHNAAAAAPLLLVQLLLQHEAVLTPLATLLTKNKKHYCVLSDLYQFSFVLFSKAAENLLFIARRKNA